MPIGPGAPTPASPLQVSVCSWAIILSPGNQNGKPQCRDQAQKQNIEQWPTVLQNRVGCGSYSRNFIAHLSVPRSCTATTSVPCTCHRTPSSTNGPSTSRSTYISFVIAWLSVKPKSSMFRQHCSSPMSSQRGSRRRCSVILGPV